MLERVTSESVRKRYEDYVLSLSGIRAVFALSGDEEDRGESISEEDSVIAVTICRAISLFISYPGASLVFGHDSRPTGRTISSFVISSFLSLGHKVLYAGVISSPEIMAASKRSDYFCYLTASHNPIGHNGWKIGRNGSVLKKTEAEKLLSILRSLIRQDDVVSTAKAIIEAEKFEYSQTKEKSVRSFFNEYRDLVLKTAALLPSFFVPVAVAADYNGSGRSYRRDSRILSPYILAFNAVNTKKGSIRHGIIPEGRNLEQLQSFLEKKHRENKAFAIGFMPDADGDRGGFVYIGEDERAHILTSQELFSLVFTIETASQVIKEKKNIAVAVNGPTSERINEIAKAFGTLVFRSEVGESNVIGLQRELEKKGYSVRLAGEGPNGGSVINPSAVRDPMNILFTLLKFLGGGEIARCIWKAFGVPDSTPPTIEKLLSCLPLYTTTEASSPSAEVEASIPDWYSFRREYEEMLSKSFSSVVPQILPSCTQYRIYSTEGYWEYEGLLPREKTGERGGFKIRLLTSKGQSLGFLWARPSGTEHKLRIMVDLKGKDVLKHDLLLSYHRNLIEEILQKTEQ